MWAIGVFVDCMTTTADNFRYHEDNSIFGGFTTHDNRDLVTRDVRLALIWPLRLLFYVVVTGIWIFNDILAGCFLVFAFKYKRTRLYNWIDTKTNLL
jgi:hypothetical protein